MPMPRSQSALDRREAVAEVRLGRRARRRRARRRRASRSSSASFACVAWTTVVRGPRQPRAGEQLDRSDAVLGEALLDLARLLVGVDVERQALALRVARRSPRASRRGQARTEWGATPTREPARRAALDLREVAATESCAEAGEPAAAVSGVEEHELDPGLRGGLGGCERLVEAEVVELADGRVAGARASRGRSPRTRPRRAPASAPPASASIASRQAQKSPPSVRPRSARWNAWQCALTKPGREQLRPRAYPVTRWLSAAPRPLGSGSSCRTR